MHDGIIIKDAISNDIMFANKTAKSIWKSSHDLDYRDLTVDMKLKKFRPVDLKEDIYSNPFDDTIDEIGKSMMMQSTSKGNKLSLSTIIKQLANQGDHGFSDSTIYKVSIPRKVRD